MKKIWIAAACIALASIAGAQKGTGGATDVLSSGPGGAASGGSLATIISSTYDPAEGSTVLVIDISGTESWDGLGDPSNTILDVPIPGTEVSGIGWEVTLTTVGASWLSESGISFQGDVFLTVGVGDDFAGSAGYTSGGIVVLGDVGIPDIPIAGGSMPVEFFESFDDVPDAVDAIYTSGTLSIQYEGGAAVPTVSGWGLVVLTALLLLGVVRMSLGSRSRPVGA